MILLLQCILYLKDLDSIFYFLLQISYLLRLKRSFVPTLALCLLCTITAAKEKHRFLATVLCNC